MLVIYLVVFMFGLVVGSFLNVCIYRLPLGKSIVSPPSACPACGTQIKPYHNIPVFSYLFLGGKCAYCGEPISVRYPAIELLNALGYTAAVYRFGADPKAFLVMLLFSVFVVITFIDLKYQIIPDYITLPGIVFGLAFGPLFFNTGFINSLVGAVAGGGLFFLIAVVSRGGMGGGDIKFIAMVGAFLGWRPVLMTIFFGSLLGALVGAGLLISKKAGRKTPIPFGPFLVAGALISIFFGENILDFYLNIGG
ncbi:MAG TPA: prepilin peptidase [Nitrospirota bacterium]|jgi:leader peptidase (prepilin peptidase)/N-methyltransferase